MRVLREVDELGSVQVRELMDHFAVSGATIRRDLDCLAERGLITRTHGGAIACRTSTSFETTYEEKRKAFTVEKRRIASAAEKFVLDGETVILDSGSTTFEVARLLAERKNLTLITNDLFIAGQITFDPSITVIVTGGMLREGFNTLVGPVTETFLRNVRVDHTVLSADAVDPVFGVSNATFAESSIKQLMVEAASHVILVADASKFGKRALARVCVLDDVDAVITDAALNDADHKSLMQASIKLILT
ncbi:MAG: DeoR/GlpR family DNA-binding transcription regulator [Trueperaceae bacterium]